MKGEILYLFYLLAILNLANCTSSTDFFYLLARGVPECFEDHIPAKLSIEGHIYYEDAGLVTVIVSGPNGLPIHVMTCDSHKDNKFTINAIESGRHKICVNNEDREQIEIHFILNKNTEESKYEIMTNVGITEISREINKLEQMTSQISSNLNDLRKTGSEQELASESKSGFIILFAMISIGVTIGSIMIQINYLKAFFKQKKII